MIKSNIKVRNQHEIDHFSKLPETWWGAKSVAGQKRYDNKYKELIKLCDINKNTKILEIGAGYGEFTRRLQKSGSFIHATDITPKVVSVSKKTFKNKKVKWSVADSNKLKFKDNLFDIVCGISILHHVETEKTLKEVYRVLKKGGEIFFTEPNLLNPHILLGLNIPWMRDKMEYSPDETALVKWKVKKMLKKIKFKEIKVRNYDFLHPKTPLEAISIIEKLGSFLEKVPLIKEISGSMIIYAKK